MMEFQWDFLESLDPDVSSKILMSLDDPADIVRACSVSRAWRDFVISNGICKHLCLRLFPKLSGIVRIIDTSNKEDVGCSRFVELEHLKKEHKAYVALARGLTSSEVGECLSNAISASSTDNYPEEGLHNTLESRERIGRRPSYWSSSGQSNPEVPERLTYQLISDFCIITEINVQPFQAFFQSDSPIYSAKAVRFHMGHRILPDDDGDQCDEIHEGHECAEKKFVWTYTSQDFPMTQIELLGRVQRQEMDGLFYICVAHVQVLGRSLDPVFGVKSLDPSGRFTLVHNPQAKFSAPRSSNEESDEISVTPEMVQRHVRGWEQILNMLRGTLGVEVYDSEDEILYSEDEMAEELEL
uniref:F-box domain-containing protein n=1 Tax=Chenopodium quinoa TaxID=63459 RepID=A0A803M3E6_CHEQI